VLIPITLFDEFVLSTSIKIIYVCVLGFTKDIIYSIKSGQISSRKKMVKCKM